MPTDVVFSGYEDEIFLVKNSNGYFIPSFNVMTLEQMCPGEAYGVFLSGTEGLDFMYSSGGLASTHASSNYITEDMNVVSDLDVDPTGESHLLIVEGFVNPYELSAADQLQLRAYDNEDRIVGAYNIDQSHLDYNGSLPISDREGSVIALVVHTAVDHPVTGSNLLPGCSNSDITLKLYNATEDKEYIYSTPVAASCSGSIGYTELGRAKLEKEDIYVASFELGQNYPNPFNPTTTISYNVEMDGIVTLKIYDITGRLVKTLVNNEFKVAGGSNGYKAIWDGTDNLGTQVSAGLYLYLSLIHI